jgi:hypothetical protein
MLGQILSNQALSMQANRLCHSKGGDTLKQDIQEGRKSQNGQKGFMGEAVNSSWRQLLVVAKMGKIAISQIQNRKLVVARVKL